jgi:hypothetical protein
MSDFRGLLGRLAESGFPFVVVGGYAAFAHGVTLVTQDLDVCCEFTETSLRQLKAAIGDLHPVHRMRPDRMALELPVGFHEGLRNLYLDTDWGPLDLLGEIKGIGPYPKAFDLSIEVIVEEQEIRLLSLEGIIRAKEAMDRPRDIEAVRQLKAIQQGL